MKHPMNAKIRKILNRARVLVAKIITAEDVAADPSIDVRKVARVNKRLFAAISKLAKQGLSEQMRIDPSYGKRLARRRARKGVRNGTPKKKPKQPVIIPIPTDGVYIQAVLTDFGRVKWDAIPVRTDLKQDESYSLYNALRKTFRAFGMDIGNKGTSAINSVEEDTTRNFRGAFKEALRQFNSRSHRRRFGIWFKVSTEPLDRAYVAWKLTQGGGQT